MGDDAAAAHASRTKGVLCARWTQIYTGSHAPCAQVRREQKEAAEANEILELRSLGIRTAMAKYKEELQMQANGMTKDEHKISKAALGSAFYMG
jgi:hypothetical protein